MDIDFYIQRFEWTMRSYVGDDPLSAWERFVEFLEPRLAPDEKNKLSVVIEKLVQTFLPETNYHNDLRFINFCIRYASFQSDPVKAYSDVHTHGVGKHMVALYISWAQQCERRNLDAEHIYQKAFSNRAEPLDTLQHHYRLFQSKRVRSQTTPAGAVNTPLQDSQLVNQLRHRDSTQPQCKDVLSAPIAADGSGQVVSRSENNPHPSSRTQCVSMYCVSELVCEELSFEELRARRYFTKLRQQEVQRECDEVRRKYEEEEEEVVRMKKLLEELNSKLTDETQHKQVSSGSHPVPGTEDTPNPADQSEALPGLCVSLTHSAEWRAEEVCESPEEPLPGAECTSRTLLQHTLKRDEPVGDEFVGDVNTDVSYGGFTHHSHVTPNTSLVLNSATPSRALPSPTVNTREALVSYGGFTHHSHVTPNTSLVLNSATPSRALPSPTVNTREALDLIGNMFQGPTLLQDSMFNSTHINTAVEDSFENKCKVSDFAPLSVKALPTAPFRIYQDENDENRSVDPQVVMKPKSAGHRTLVEVPVSTANVTLQGAESITDESTVWGSGHAPMASFPNHTQDFALSAHLVSTPLHPVTPYSRDTQLSQVESGVEENPYLRQPAKLSPILEQSPSEEKQGGGVECTPSAQGTIVGECLSLQRHAHFLTQDSQTHTSITRQALAPLHALAPLTFPDQSFRTKPSWNVYQSPNQELKTSGVSTVGDFNSNRELNSKNLALGRDCFSDQANSNELNSNILHKPDQVNSNSLTSMTHQFISHSNREFSSHNQNPVRDVLPEPLNSSRLSAEELKIFQEIKPDHINSNPSQQSDVEEADLLLPERSFNMRRSVGLLPENPQTQQWKSFLLPRSPDPPARANQDLPMSPEPALGFGWLQVESPVLTAEPDLDLMESPTQTHRPDRGVHSDPHTSSVLERSGILLWNSSFDRRRSERPLLLSSSAAERSGCVSPVRDSNPVSDVPMSPAAAPGLDWNSCDDVLMMSPQPNNKTPTTENVPEISQKLNCDDVPMSPTQPCAPPTASVLISDPWDENLIASLLAGLHTPLSSYTNLSTWSCRVPSILPKLTVQMGNECLRVDRVVGRGAFATVYQATDLDTSHKLILKVQKPSNLWEFYINSQLNTRVEPPARHLYNQLHRAHLFNNGSVLIGELHNCGTLLNVVNLYRSRSEKVMPQPLVLYFTVCILDMVERLHAARIIHADIKPDNFLLGQRFLENKSVSEGSLEHGLVLVDFGQSIDMSLFPDGAQFTAHCMTSGFQCTEMLSGRSWTYQTDYFGVAGTVYCMLFGSYMQVRLDGGVWKSGGVFKRNPHSELWQDFFQMLLNVPHCLALPCLRVLRQRMSFTLMTNYSTKLLGLKNRLAVHILESRTSCR